MLVIGLLLVVAVVCGIAAALTIRRWPPADPSVAAIAVGQELRGWARLRKRILPSTDPASATGIALFVAVVVAVLGGLVLGVLAWMVRSNSGLATRDLGVARWGAHHATPFSTTVLRGITDLGATGVIVAVAVAVGSIEWLRIRNRWLPVFLVLVIGGQLLIVNLIKVGVGRARPAIDPLARFSGASFPSGHSAAAAACYAALALLLSRRRSPKGWSVLGGCAVAIAVAVAGSRVLLGVHWLTDVIAGLALGWAWFALCAIAFGGRWLRLGAPIELAEENSATGSFDVAILADPATPIAFGEADRDEVIPKRAETDQR